MKMNGFDWISVIPQSDWHLTLVTQKIKEEYDNNDREQEWDQMDNSTQQLIYNYCLSQ